MKTKKEIETAMTAIALERSEIFDELDKIAAESEPNLGTPRHHIHELKTRAAELLEEYYRLWGELDKATA